MSTDKIADSRRVQSVVGWMLVVLGLVHVALTFSAYQRFTLDALWFMGSGALVLLIGALNVTIGQMPGRFYGNAGAGRAIVLGSNVAGLLLSGAFMWLQGGPAMPGPVLTVLFAVAVIALLKRGNGRRAGPDLFGTGPVIPVADVHAAVEFYRDKLGFDVDFEMGTPPNHGSVTRCGTGIQFTLARPEAIRDQYAGWTYVFITGVDALHSEYAGRGVTVTQPLGSREHGMREFEIADLNGHRLRFGEYLS